MEEHEVLHIISRAKARELGMAYYFTGNSCPHGHFSRKRVSTKGCIGCEQSKERKEYMKKWRSDNKELNAKIKRDWYDNNLEHKKDYDRKYHIRKREYVNKYWRDRYHNNEGHRMLVNIRGMVKRSLELCDTEKSGTSIEIIGYSPADIKQNIEKKFLGGMSWENKGCWHIDHLYPVSRFIQEGVTDPAIINSLNNLAPLWKEHNLDKSDKTLEEWLLEKGEDSEEYLLYGHYLNKL